MVKDTGEEVAVKKLDLENMNCSLDEIIREAQTMRSLNHPNLLPLHCSFVHEQDLWMVMPYVHGGSVLNIMRFRFQDGLEEPAIATIMKDILKALDYLHRNGIIHRDIKAGNILLNSDGHVLLADFGVAATLERGGSWGNRMLSRNTFVGTPCWMAPEVMQEQGYDSKADIWSFGITLLELAHGHAPFARLPPMKVLLMTLQNPPPTLDQADSKKHFSKAMRDIVAKCLIKDPLQRPTAGQLLDHKFFKTAHDQHYLQRHILDGLPPVAVRVEMMRQAHGGAGAGGGKAESQDKEILASQQEYRRGVSSWNFDVEAIKAAAAAAAQAEAERLPAIRESMSDLSEISTTPGLLSHQVSDASLMAGNDGTGSPTKSITSPSRTNSNASILSGKGPGSAKHGIKEHGRFKVYEGADEPPPFSPPGNGPGAALMEEAQRMRSSTPGVASGDDLDDEKAKRKGRFRYVEEELGPDGKPRGTKPGGGSVGEGPVGGAGSGVTSPSGIPQSSLASVGTILDPLKELLESVTLQHESLRELTAAVRDAEKGKMGALNAYLNQRQQQRLSPQDEANRLRAEVSGLREENALLREKLKVYEGHEGSRPSSIDGSLRGATTSADELASA